MVTTATEIITLPVLLKDLRAEKAMTIRQVRESLALPGRRLRKPHADSVRRWASPSRGYRPAGLVGPVVVLPTVRLHGEMLTCPEWVQWFLGQCAEARERFGM